ncbi:MAG: glycine cleavage H-protein [Deltaproteobacteria bacterium]|nr:glycine cleavage H-protein [Deltaproteobacteria bacterium]
MVVLLFLLTVLGCVAVDLALRRRKQAAEEARVVRAPVALFPSRAAQELPGGLFVHSGHTWAKLDSSGALQVGLDGFAQGILGRVDRFELPADGATLRQGEPAFAALQSGKRIEFVSPVDGVVCAVNERINADPAAARKEPYEKGWAFAVRPSNLPRNLKKLRIGAEASAWLEKEARSFTEFLTLYRPAPVEVGVTLPDGGVHAEGVMETMDGEILQIAIRKYFR